MKKMLFLKCVSVYVALTGILHTANAQTTSLSFYNGVSSICGVEQKTQDLKVNFCYCCTGNIVNCDPSACSIGNPFRATVNLYRNGMLVATRSFNLSSPYFNEYFTGLPVWAGTTFFASVQFERKKAGCVGWQTISNLNTNILTTPVIQGTPDFKINGMTVLPNSQSMDVCASSIWMDATNTTCEKDYFLSIAEFGNDWTYRTNDYEIKGWFSGEAPNINLQQVAVIYSNNSAYYTGSPSRKGSPLIGGNLPNGQTRHYLVELCIGPNWTCKNAFIKVNGNCRTGSGEDDANEYTVVSGDQSIGDLLGGKKNLADSEKPTLTLYPNPSSGIFTLNVDRVISGGIISVIDYTGKEVLKTNYIESGASIDLSAFKKGLYLITFKSDNISASKTIILE